MRRIVVTGSESVGKTSLAQKLGDHFGVPVSREFVRAYAAERGGKLAFGDVGAVARGQIAAEDAAIARAKDMVVLDTDLVSTVVYCEHYFGLCPDWIDQESRKRIGHLYLLLAPDIPWVADGVRDRGERRAEMHELFRGSLDARRLRYAEIRGEQDERLSAALEAIASMPPERR
jgi:NadR type nicotinamide-nucleotide adenylyltransferase